MRKLKQWEEEKRVLMEGLKVITSAQNWYESRLKRVRERLKFGSDPSGNPVATTDAAQVSTVKEVLSERSVILHAKPKIVAFSPDVRWYVFALL